MIDKNFGVDAAINPTYIIALIVVLFVLGMIGLGALIGYELRQRRRETQTYHHAADDDLPGANF